jgi:predicted amidohydrolase YtcJ
MGWFKSFYFAATCQIVGCVCFLLFGPLQTVLNAQNQADTILFNGKIVTVDEQFSIAQALAIRDGRVLQVGSDADLLKLKSDATRLIDLKGKMVLPGLMDSHTHPGPASTFEFDHPVPEMESIQDVLDYIQSRAKIVPEGEWIWVNQVFITRLKEKRYPTRSELDQAAPLHAVVFSTGPDASVNTLALKLSSIDKDFRVTGSGAIEKDARTGEPTGILRGGTKRYLKSRSNERQPTDQEQTDQLVALLRDYNSVGITAIADRNANDAAIQRYAQLYEAEQLTTRVAISHALGTSDEVDTIQQEIRKIAAHPLCQGDTMLRIVGVKTFQDGGMLTGSAYMREPWGVSQIYSIDDPRYQGVLFIPKEKLLPIVRTTIENKLQFTAHSVGDGAVHNLVDVYEEINEALPIRATRPCITHCNFMSLDAVQRMAKLGIVADIQPAWLYLDARTLTDHFGYERLRYFQPLKTIFAEGAIAGGGSDHMQKIGSLRSINPYNPFLGMWVTITRQAKNYDGRFHPEESLTREQAIRFYTQNNAYLMFLDAEAGSLEKGKAADLIVLDRDILNCEVEQIKDTQVLVTYLNGKAVYERD